MTKNTTEKFIGNSNFILNSNIDFHFICQPIWITSLASRIEFAQHQIRYSVSIFSFHNCGNCQSFEFQTKKISSKNSIGLTRFTNSIYIFLHSAFHIKYLVRIRLTSSLSFAERYVRSAVFCAWHVKVVLWCSFFGVSFRIDLAVTRLESDNGSFI